VSPGGKERDYIQSSSTDRLLGSEHYDMSEAIRRQDVDQADRLAHEHTRQFHDQFMDFLKCQYATISASTSTSPPAERKEAVR